MEIVNPVQKGSRTFYQACFSYFGQRPGCTKLQDFMSELRTLSLKDRQELTPLLEAEMGIDIIPAIAT